MGVGNNDYGVRGEFALTQPSESGTADNNVAADDMI
jgi:hypothetical protein